MGLESKKTSLTKREEDAEGQLKLVTEELSGLKRHIAQMTQAIFGEYLLMILRFSQVTRDLCI